MTAVKKHHVFNSVSCDFSSPSVNTQALAKRAAFDRRLFWWAVVVRESAPSGFVGLVLMSKRLLPLV